MAERAVPQENTGINTGIQQSNGPYPEATAESLDHEDLHQQGKKHLVAFSNFPSNGTLNK